MRRVFAVVGLIVAAGVDLAINLVAAAIQDRSFAEGFSGAMLVWLGVAAVIGLLVGYFLSGPVTVPTTLAAGGRPPVAMRREDGVTITRLRALFSLAELRGQGVMLSDILLVGSRIKIDTRE